MFYTNKKWASFVAIALAAWLWAGALAVPAVWGQDPAPESLRIISMGPSVTETLFALGCGSLVAGVSDYCVYPPKALEKPRVGGLLNPNLERFAALEPNLVILRGALDKVVDYCRFRNIKVLETQMDSIAGIHATIELLGRTLGAEQRAGELNQAIARDLEDVKSQVRGLSRPKVLICVGRSPGGLSSIFTCGQDSFVSQVLDIAGGENVFGDAPTAYPEISKESLMRRAPDIILDMRPAEDLSPAQIGRIVDEWSPLRTLPAVRNRRVHVMTQDFLLVPGPRVGSAARAMAEVLHGASLNPGGGRE